MAGSLVFVTYDFGWEVVNYPAIRGDILLIMQLIA